MPKWKRHDYMFYVDKLMFCWGCLVDETVYLMSRKARSKFCVKEFTRIHAVVGVQRNFDRNSEIIILIRTVQLAVSRVLRKLGVCVARNKSSGRKNTLQDDLERISAEYTPSTFVIHTTSFKIIYIIT